MTFQSLAQGLYSVQVKLVGGFFTGIAGLIIYYSF
jgi:hypothetical protein